MVEFESLNSGSDKQHEVITTQRQQWVKSNVFINFIAMWLVFCVS